MAVREMPSKGSSRLHFVRQEGRGDEENRRGKLGSYHLRPRFPRNVLFGQRHPGENLRHFQSTLEGKSRGRCRERENFIVEICTYCQQKGFCLECSSKRCSKMMHPMCAKTHGCALQLDPNGEETRIFCINHQSEGTFDAPTSPTYVSFKIPSRSMVARPLLQRAQESSNLYSRTGMMWQIPTLN